MVEQLLTIDRQKRIRAEDIINHPWMVQEARRESLVSVQDNLKKFKSKLIHVKNAIKAVRLMQSFQIPKKP